MKRTLSTRALVFAGLLIALEILLSRFVQIPVPGFEVSKDRISLGFLPIATGGMLYGPLGGGIIAALSDILRAILLPQGGAINPLFTVTATLRGVLYGMFLCKRQDWKRISAVSFLIFILVNLGLNSAFTAYSYGGTFVARLITKLPAAVSNFLIQLAVLIPVLPKLERRLRFHA